MLPRERVLAAINYRAPDMLPLQIHPSPAGLFEHGHKLLELMQNCPQDFGDSRHFALPAPPEPGDWDADGRYHAFRTDEWGTGWEYRIFGVWGHRRKYPLADLDALSSYRAPAPPPLQGPEFETELQAARVHRQCYFLAAGGGLLFERMQCLRPFQDVLIEVMLDTPEINQIADLIVENQMGYVQRALALGADAVTFGDDFGMQDRPFFSPQVWRRFFRPRYSRLFEPVLRAGKQVFFHCCGYIPDLLSELADLGVRAIWPQLTAFNLTDLAHRCRELGLAVQLHPDRGELMQHGTPDQIRSYLHKLCETFDTGNGGSWLYVEIDPGFPFQNVEAILDMVRELRNANR
jgi:hypothetical protein